MKTGNFFDVQLQYDFAECQFLKEPDIALEKRRDLSAKNLRSIIKKFELSSKKITEIVLSRELDRCQDKLIPEIHKLKKESSDLNSKISIVQSEYDSLQRECQMLPQEIAEKEDEMSDLSLQLQQFKIEMANIDQDSLRIKKDFREALEGIKVLKMCYKNHLDLHITLLSSKGDTNEFLVTFSSFKPRSIDPMPSDSLKIQYNCKNETWKLISTNPPLPNFQLVSQKVEESQDVKGLLYFVRPSIRAKSNDIKNKKNVKH